MSKLHEFIDKIIDKFPSNADHIVSVDIKREFILGYDKKTSVAFFYLPEEGCINQIYHLRYTNKEYFKWAKEIIFLSGYEINEHENGHQLIQRRQWDNTKTQ